jgi:hypothetical protein
MLYIAAKQFKEYCVDQQTNYGKLLQELTTLEVYLESTNKRMSKGMKVASPPVRVLKFDASTTDFLQVDSLLASDEDRDGLVSA